MIVVISHPKDLHASAVLSCLERRGVQALLLDISDFPERATLSIDHETPTPTCWLDHVSRGSIELSAASAVWWRRPQAPDLSSIQDADALGFAHGEWNEALYGLYPLLACPWMNDPVRDEVASRKALQLTTARALGMRVPRTLMTSNPTRARDFIDRVGLGSTIFKTFSATHQVWRETRLVREEDLEILDSLRLAPAIFQEYIPARADVRISIVGDRLFPMAIDTRGTSYEVDFRLSLHEAEKRAAQLPEHVTSALRALMRHYGLAYGAVDLRQSSDGDYVFLEVNPAGEFLFLENTCQLPVTEAIADWLSAPK